jgi:hypothetical protein
MTTAKDRSNLMNVMAYVSLALAVSAQAGTAIWWAGIINTRVAMLERQLDDLAMIRPEQIRDVAEALRAIAVIEERMIRLDENIARIGTAVGELSRMGARP